jgi:hypothetical protein
MKKSNHTELEAEITKTILTYVESEHADSSARIVAGALMRASILIASEVIGPERAAKASRQALDNILINLEPWRLQ